MSLQIKKDNKIYHLEKWGTLELPTNYHGIDNHIHLYGIREEDKKDIISSEVVESNGNVVQTRSGSVYILGTPSDDYVKYLAEKEQEICFANYLQTKKTSIHD